MWLFATKGFVSIVENENDPSLLLVRGRFRGDIDKLFPGHKVTETPNKDYRFRTTVPRPEVARRVAELVLDIDYPNFKDAAPKDRHNVYLDVWTALYREQIKRLPRPKAKRRAKKKGYSDFWLDDDPSYPFGLPLGRKQ
jgi:hypothetical protein